MPAHKIGEILSASGALKALSRPARRLAELERLLSETVPRALAEATRINGIRAGTLLVAADNAAVATKLRQLAPRLLNRIAEREPEITGIRVDVQPTARAVERAVLKQPIAPRALEQFRQLASELPESQLKSAVGRLVRRRSRPG